MLRHQIDKFRRGIFADISAFQTAGDKVETPVFQQLTNHHLRLVARQLAMEQLLTVLIHQRAVFGDKGDGLFQLREKGDQLVILVATGDHKLNTALLKLFELRHKACAIVLLGVIKESSVHIRDDNFDGHTWLLNVTTTSNILERM
ncbi:Hypothetical protein AKI40_2282 [Enterobacter sp. FY-07]|nr:Hypothetical protein AKI40_2282 [Enterobacter sp. FY-07]